MDNAEDSDSSNHSYDSILKTLPQIKFLQQTNVFINSDCLCLCDWNDTIMRTTYLLSSIEYEFDEITRKFNEFIFYRDQKTLISHFQQVGNRTFELLNTMLIH
eukprot:68731_1